MMITHGTWGCKIKMKQWLQRLIDWLTGACSSVAWLHSLMSCLLWDTSDWQIFLPLHVCFLSACFWAIFFQIPGFFLRFCSFLRHFWKIWKSMFFLVIWNILKLRISNCFSGLHDFQWLGPNQQTQAQRVFLNLTYQNILIWCSNIVDQRILWMKQATLKTLRFHCHKPRIPMARILSNLKCDPWKVHCCPNFGN